MYVFKHIRKTGLDYKSFIYSETNDVKQNYIFKAVFSWLRYEN